MEETIRVPTDFTHNSAGDHLGPVWRYGSCPGVYEERVSFLGKSVPGVLPSPPPVSPPPASPTFSLTMTGRPLTIRTERHSSIQIEVQPLSSTLGIVKLACSDPLPVSVTCTFTPATLDISDGKTVRSAMLTRYRRHPEVCLHSPRSCPELLWAVLLLPVGLGFWQTPQAGRRVTAVCLPRAGRKQRTVSALRHAWNIFDCRDRIGQCEQDTSTGGRHVRCHTVSNNGATAPN